MSRTERQQVAPGTEWWSRRPFSRSVSKGAPSTKRYKRWSHKIERMRAKREAKEV